MGWGVTNPNSINISGHAMQRPPGTGPWAAPGEGFIWSEQLLAWLWGAWPTEGDFASDLAEEGKVTFPWL